MAFPTITEEAGLDREAEDPWSIGLPGLTSGNIYIIILALDGDVTGSINAASYPRWSKLGRAASGSAVTGEVYALASNGTETIVEIDFPSGTTGTGWRAVIQGAGGASATFSTSGGSASANTDPPSHTSYATGDHLWLTARMGDGSTVATAEPSGWSFRSQISAAAASIDVESLTSNAVSANPGAYTVASEEWVAVTIGLGDVALGSPALPTAPSGLVATALSSSSIGLSWTDNSSNETGFQIERAPHVP